MALACFFISFSIGVAIAEDVQKVYDQLIVQAREQTLRSSCSALLHWDQQTYMPRGGAQHRGEQMAYLAGLHHERTTDPRFGELLAIVGASDLVADPESPEAVNVRELSRNYERKVMIPRDLAEALARATSLVQQEWNAARSEVRFERFGSWLEKIIELKREEAACLKDITVSRSKVAESSVPGAALYDSLFDDFELGARSAEMVMLFQALRAELVPLVQIISEASARRTKDVGVSQGDASAHGNAILRRAYPLDQQKSLRRDGGCSDRIRLSERPPGCDGSPMPHKNRDGRPPDHDPLRRASIQRCVLWDTPRGRSCSL